MPVDPADLSSVAQGLEDTDEMTIVIGNPAQLDSPSPGASASAKPAASTPPDTTGAQTANAKVADEEEEDDTETDSADDTEDDSEALDEEDRIALEELRDYFAEEARKEAQEEIVPKLQSTYDRQIAQLSKQLNQVQEGAKAREQELRDQVRQAQTVGLTDVEKSELQRRWDWEDKNADLQAQQTELASIQVELLRTAYAQEYSTFGLTAEDLEDFDSVEEMEAFVKEVQIEYYRQLAEARATAPEADTEDTPKAKKSSKKPAPAGATAPTDAGGGGAPPDAPKLNLERSRVAMAENLRSGWETITIR